MTKFSKFIGLGFIAVSVVGIVWFIASLLNAGKKLPILGEPGHITGNFSFVNQDGRMITQENIKDKVVVVEYFFTTCPGICKIMNKNLSRVYNELKDAEDFTILSHTVDPLTDSVATLANYAQLMKASAPRWQFLTGEKTALYTAAKKDYLLAVEEHKENMEDEFIHTEYVALLDKHRRIRGFYDATDSVKIAGMIKDVRQLLKE